MRSTVSEKPCFAELLEGEPFSDGKSGGGECELPGPPGVVGSELNGRGEPAQDGVCVPPPAHDGVDVPGVPMTPPLERDERSIACDAALRRRLVVPRAFVEPERAEHTIATLCWSRYCLESNAFSFRWGDVKII